MDEMIGRRGRDKTRGEYPPRADEKGHFNKQNAPPSRHLWVGNLSHRTSKNALADQFLRFGEIESVAYISGRSYAFVNFKNSEDAIVAMGALQGFVIAGMPMKIEFTKLERPLTSSGEENIESKDGLQGSANYGELFFQKDPDFRPGSTERYSEKSKLGNGLEPSEVLWIGFPSFLNVDEVILKRAFSPYGGIDKITTFPGRSYAFVKFKSVVSACRAKDALQGKLFNNPRVNITFAKSDVGPDARGLTNLVLSKSSGPSASDTPPHFISGFNNPQDPASSEFSGVGPGSRFDQIRLHGMCLEERIAEDLYEQSLANATVDKGGHRHDFLLDRAQRPVLFDGSWVSSDESLSFPEAKKLKLGPFSDNELPEYPFVDSSQRKLQAEFPRFFPQRNFGATDFNQFLDPPKNLNPLYANKDDLWKACDTFETGPSPSRSTPFTGQRFPSDVHLSPSIDVWKWEGTIAKGGTPVCRARCLPVGKVLDFMLPEFLNCTARTSLDMLAKHYYQAAGSWVVFFVAETDSDIVFYNEFMHYLEEKQRVAVAKLSDKTTLFLVPPSDFSEKVLKVPGKMSISGVILRFQHLSSDHGSPRHALEVMKSKHQSLDPSNQRSSSVDPSLSTWGADPVGLQLVHPPQSTSIFLPRGPESVDFEKVTDSIYESRQHRLHHSNLSSWSQDIGRFSSQPQDDASSVSVPPFQSEQLAQLATLLGQRQRQQEQHQGKPVLPLADDVYLPNPQGPSEPMHTARRPLELPDRTPGSSHGGRIQQLVPTEVQPGSLDSRGGLQPREDSDADPQKRLQATLQLAAALLQQIQQQAKTVE